MLTQEQLKEILHYDPETGVWTWLKPTCKRIMVGEKASCNKKRPSISINGWPCEIHRLAFLYMTGSIPEIVDHKDRNTRNCKWDNLRSATKSQNACNAKVPSHNKIGIKGISQRRDGKYVGRTNLNGKTYRTKPNENLAQVVNELKSLREDLHGEFANHGHDS